MNFDKMTSGNEIVKIDNIYEITTGTLEELKLVNPNQIGHVIDKNGTVISDITPIIMIINQNRNDMVERLKIMQEIGGDFDKKINYYNNTRSANDILATR